MFMTELKFPTGCLNHFSEKKKKKIKSHLLEFSQERKLCYEKSSPLDREEDRCVICDFPFDVNAKDILAGATEITYYDFIIKK